MNRIFIYGIRAKQKDLKYFEKLFSILESKGCEVGIDKSFAKELESLGLRNNLNQIKGYQELKEFKPEAVFAMGGDGTILNATTLIRNQEIPILGINLGRLGFLASMEDYGLTIALDKFFSGKYTIQDRSMIQLNSEPQLFGQLNFALNDCTILKRDTTSMITVHAYVNGEFLNSYWADGLIISTATGSTAYSLSGGGPIIFPGSGNFLITPVAPHNLTARPIVLPENSEIELRVEGRSDDFLCTLDARYERIKEEHILKIKKCPFNTKLIRLEGESFFKSIRNKLAWGRDSRN